MYYLIETKDQLDRFFRDEKNECYLQFIVNNNETHPALQSVCALYIYSFSKEKGFIININHPEAFELEVPLSYLQSYTNIFVRDKVSALLHLNLPYTDIQSAHYLATNKPLESQPKTGAHTFFVGKYKYHYNPEQNGDDDRPTHNQAKHVILCNTARIEV